MIAIGGFYYSLHCKNCPDCLIYKRDKLLDKDRIEVMAIETELDDVFLFLITNYEALNGGVESS